MADWWLGSTISTVHYRRQPPPSRSGQIAADKWLTLHSDVKIIVVVVLSLSYFSVCATTNRKISK